MGFIISSDEQGRSRVVINNEPEYIVPLAIAPSAIEECLKQGKWLIVNMSVWNANDITAGHRAIEVVKKYKGAIRLGLRPFDEPRENTKWIAGLGVNESLDLIGIVVSEHDDVREVIIQDTEGTSPLWLAISKGNVVGLWHGKLIDADIEKIIGQLMSIAS